MLTIRNSARDVSDIGRSETEARDELGQDSAKDQRHEETIGYNISRDADEDRQTQLNAIAGEVTCHGHERNGFDEKEDAQDRQREEGEKGVETGTEE